MLATTIASALLLMLSFCTAAPAVSAGTDREGKEHLLRRFEEMRKRRVPRGGVLDANVRSVAIDAVQRKAPSKLDVDVLAEQPQWTVLGPRSTAGRIKSIVCDPTRSNVIYIGAASGGVWKSTDGGLSWTPIMDDANAIAMGALCIAPDDPNTIYAGTGEQVVGANIYLGGGLMRSTDQGASWSVVGLTSVGSFSRVIIPPSSPSTIIAAGMNEQAGVWKSLDKGLTWQRLYQGQIYDLTMHATDPNSMFIAVPDSGIMSTTDGGTTWQRRMSGLVGSVGRASVQQATTDPNILYTLMEMNSLALIAKSTDKGLTWRIQYQDLQGCFFSGACVPKSSQGFYDNCLAIDPRNADHVIAGGIDLYMTRDGGSTWINTTDGYSDGDGNGHPHVDQHCIAFDPLDPEVVYVGNDGGMMRSADGGTSYQPINNGLSVSQFYAFDVDRETRGRLFGGTQDNGTLGTNGDAEWDSLNGGDGMTTLLDPSNSNVLYGSGPDGDLFRIRIAQQSVARITVGIDLKEESEWVAPIAIHPSIPATLLTGRERVYMSDNNGDSWRPISPRFSHTVTSIAVSPADDDLFWAVGSYGDVVRSTDFGASWTSVHKAPLSLLYISDIACARNDRNVAWITYSSYGTSQVWKTTDLGESWWPVWNHMPNVPVNTIVLHPDDDEVAFVGTDIGVFATYDGGRSWSPFGVGLPRSPVLDLKADKTFSYLRAATHGRSVWEAPLLKIIPTDPMFVVPAGGERFVPQNPVFLSWKGLTAPYNVFYSINDGQTWLPITTNDPSDRIRWIVPNSPTATARIRVTSATAPFTSIDSKSFSIVALKPGVVLGNYACSWTAYGLATDGGNGLWTTDIHSNKLYKFSRDLGMLMNIITIKGAGDSLFTDLSFDRDSGLIYVHRLDDYDGTSTTVFVIDTFGTVKRSFPSQARRYGVGLEYINGDLYGSERDGEQRIVIMDPITGALRSSISNPFRSTFGPRGIAADGLGNLVQAHTAFPPAGVKLSTAVVAEIPLSDLSQITETLLLENRKGLINARGIEIDQRDQSMWVSDIDGVIWKIAGMNYVPPTTSVDQTDIARSSVVVAPHPITTAAMFTISPIGTDRILSLEIVDVTGRIVHTLPALTQSSDFPVTFRLHAGTLAGGTYLLRSSNTSTSQIHHMFIVTP
ncbi:MAG: hypothetical protein IPH49_09190 [Ignavibacteria bacterium]|nr:hypothetical protein [Ignavibacteria bacterium]